MAEAVAHSFWHLCTLSKAWIYKVHLIPATLSINMLFVLVKVLKCVNDSGTKSSELSPVPIVNTLFCASNE